MPPTPSPSASVWWHDAILAPSQWWLAGVVVVSIIVICLAIRVMAVLGKMPRRPRTGLAADNEGTATIEFTLVMPFLLFATLLLAQTTLLMVGNVFVHYAAFAATRAAIVLIPAIVNDEPAHTLINAPGHAKYDRIHRAAAFAVTPVSGYMPQGSAAATDLAAGLSSHYTAMGVNPPAWIDHRLADQYRYADQATEVSVMRTIFSFQQPNDVAFADVPDGASYSFGPKEPITVRVAHRLYLAIPYIGGLFADGRLDGAESSTSSLGTQGTSARYTLVTAQYTLVNEGIRPELPPAPELPRFP